MAHIEPHSQQLSFAINGNRFAAQAWGQADGLPVLALHGWLDNSASFFRLAPLLQGAYVVALDMAGHGFSDHRTGHGPYNIWEDIAEINTIVDQLGWQRFALLGHSRGAMMSTLFAGTYPEKISHLGLLDGLMPAAVAAGDAPEQLARSIADVKRRREPKTYSCQQQMIAAREGGHWKLSKLAAQKIVERGTVKVEGGFRWSSDPRLLAASAVKLTQEHIDAFVGRIQAPVKLLLAEQGVLERYRGKLSYPAIGEPVTLSGSHHFHMEEQAVQIADILREFYGLS